MFAGHVPQMQIGRKVHPDMPHEQHVGKAANEDVCEQMRERYSPVETSEGANQTVSIHDAIDSASAAEFPLDANNRTMRLANDGVSVGAQPAEDTCGRATADNQHVSLEFVGQAANSGSRIAIAGDDLGFHAHSS